MDLARTLRIGLGLLVGMTVLLAFGSIGLLTRMTPAIAQIMDENVVSLDAGEHLLAQLTLHAAGALTSEQAGVSARRIIARARENITEPEERVLIAEIERGVPRALAGDRGALATVVSSLRRLGDVNRRAMGAADVRAQQLGVAGAWAAVLLATIALVVSVVVWMRLELRLVAPLVELLVVVRAAAHGDGHRRCRPMPAATELTEILTEVNLLLDRPKHATPATLHERQKT